MKRNPLRAWLPYAFAAIVAPLIAAWPQGAQAGDWVFDNAGVAITDAVATTVNWTTANVWNPDGNNPGAALDGVWANAILNATGLPASTAGCRTKKL